MFQRRSTLDPTQKIRKNKQTQQLSILEKCLQIPSDDKLLLRNFIKNQNEEILTLLQKYKKCKNISQLQIGLRKIIQKIKMDDHKSWIRQNKFKQEQKYKENRRCSERTNKSNKLGVSQTSSTLITNTTITLPIVADVPIILEHQHYTKEQLQKKIENQIQNQINKQLDNLNDISINFKDITIRDQQPSSIFIQSSIQPHQQQQAISRQLCTCTSKSCKCFNKFQQIIYKNSYAQKIKQLIVSKSKSNISKFNLNNSSEESIQNNTLQLSNQYISFSQNNYNNKQILNFQKKINYNHYLDQNISQIQVKIPEIVKQQNNSISKLSFLKKIDKNYQFLNQSIQKQNNTKFQRRLQTNLKNYPLLTNSKLLNQECNLNKTNKNDSIKYGQFYKRIKMAVDGTLQ